MKKLIISLAIIACSTIAQAQAFDSNGNYRSERRPTVEQPTTQTPWPQHQTQYPPDYFSVPQMSPTIPSGPTYGYPNQRAWNPRTGLWESSPYTNSW